MNNIPLLDPVSSAPCYFNFDRTTRSEITMVAKKALSDLKNNWRTMLLVLGGTCVSGAFFPTISIAAITIVALIALSSTVYSNANSDLKLLNTLHNKNFNLTKDQEREILLIKKMATPLSFWYVQLADNFKITGKLPEKGTEGYSQLLQTIAWGKKLRELLENFQTKHPDVNENIKVVFSDIKPNLNTLISLFNLYLNYPEDENLKSTKMTPQWANPTLENIRLIEGWFQDTP